MPFASRERRLYRAVWADPARKARTLESFSQTEANGGVDIRAAARRAIDPEVKKHLTRHGEDEVRHAEMFRERARALYAEGVGRERELGLSDRAANLDTTGAAPADSEGVFGSHGFLSGSRFDDVGEVVYVAQLHVAEKEAARLFEVHRDLNAHDPETAAVFDAILKDEKYHVSWTGTVLERWRKEGRAGEVKSALNDAQGSRFLGAWKRLGIRSAGSFGRVVMWLFYFTVLLPFALIARRQREGGDWHEAPAPTTKAGLGAQY